MFGNMGGNMAGMMKKMQKLQADMGKVQEELKNSVIEVSTGGGAVKVEVTGEKRVKSIKIDSSAVDAEDIEMLEDLIMAAVNEGMTKVDDLMAKEMGKLTGGLNLPPGLF